MAFCPNCGEKLNDGAKFCSGCGVSIITASNDNSQRRTVFEGEMHKCPNCGEILNAFTTNCPVCGYELRGSQASNSVREFAFKLERIESGRESKKSKFVFTQVLSGNNISKTDEQKISLIRSFTIPNTKEDIFEFMILAASNIDLKLYGLGNQGIITASQRAVSDAWLAKFEQAYQKAQITFGMSPEFLNISKIHDDKIKALKMKKLQIPMLIIGILALAFLPWLLVLILK